MKQVFIQFNHAPYIICLREAEKITRCKQINIKGNSSVVLSKELIGNRQQAWVEIEDDVEVELIDIKEEIVKPNLSASNFYRQGADKYFVRHLSHLKDKPNLQFLEIGSYAGSSALGVIEDILTDKSSTITCVDIWYSPFAEDKFNEVTEGYKEQVIKQVAWSAEWLKKNQKKQFDFIYIDGDHSAEAVKIDMELSWNILKPGGIMAIDDYNYPHPRGEKFNQKPAIDTFITSVSAEVLEIDEQVWLKKIQNN
jgi:16S rRNA G966 N2-methylase RsmD